MALQIGEGTVPQDDVPFTSDDAPQTDDTESTGWFNADYPHSTEEHPFGYFPISASNPEPDFTRPRKRRPHNRGGSSAGATVARSAQADKTAQTAAAMLARINSLIGMSLMSFGMPLSGGQIIEANDVFKDMAYEALQTDPNLARKILSAGASSGKAQLTMAYVMLFGSVTPVAMTEIKERRKENENNE